MVCSFLLHSKMDQSYMYIYPSPLDFLPIQFPRSALGRVPRVTQNVLVSYLFFCAGVLSCFSPVSLFVTQWTVAYQAPLSVGFSRQEYWSGLPCPSPGDLPNPGIESRSPAFAGGFFTASAT